MRKKAALQLSVSFLVILIICIAAFSLSVYIIKRFFTHAEKIRDIYDERTEKEIERLLDDGSKVAIPFDKKIIYNGEADTFGIGILNMLDTGAENEFQITINFSKAYDKENEEQCDMTNPGECGNPQKWLKAYSGISSSSGLIIDKTIRNNEQQKFLIGVEPKYAPAGLYVFNLNVEYLNDSKMLPYDTLHKLYVEVP